jgi:3-phenylpropionate/trans-cinnamate dioxygenase ferredoxin subunit
MARYEVCPVEELPPGSMKIVPAGATLVGVYNCGGEYFALEDRCSHDDGPLVEGEWEPESCTVICPRHGSNFDLRTGRPLSLPAYEPVETYRVEADDGIIYVEVPG